MNETSQPRKKRHCMVVHAYYPLGETRVEREALALVDAGYQVDVISLMGSVESGFERVNGVDVYRLPVRRKRTGGMVGQLIEYLKFCILAFFKLMSLYPRKRYQTIQTHNLPDFLVFSALIPKLMGARVILDFHDLMPEFFAYKRNLSMESGLVRLLILHEQISSRFADHVITVTDLWKNRLINRGVRADKVSVVMNLPDERYFNPIKRAEEESKIGKPFKLIYHGTFKEHYGLKELILAVDKVRAEIPGIHLTLQGVGEFAPQMERIVEELNLQNQITINNFAMGLEQIPKLISQADMGVVPNRNDVFTGDLLPTKLMEYIALELPIIASRTRVISQYFAEDMIQFFNPGDADSLAQQIVYAYQHWDEMILKKENCAQFSEKYRWEHVSRSYVELVDRLRLK